MVDSLVQNRCSSCGAGVEDSSLKKCPYCLSFLEESTSEKQESKIKPCPNCGSVVTFNIEEQRFDCQSCDTNFTLNNEKKASKYEFQAEKIFPFQVTQDLAKLKFFEWLSNGKNIPLGIVDQVENITLEQLYIPYLNISASYNGTWSADIGYDRTEMYTEYVTLKDNNGKKYSKEETRSKIVTDWNPMKEDFTGSVSKNYVVGDGLSELETSFLDSIHFNYGKVQAILFDKHYLSETSPLEINQEKLGTSITRIDTLGRKNAETQMKNLLPGDRNRQSKIISYTSKSYGRYIYVPFWRINYIYKENEYTTLVSAFNSELIRLEGKKPINEQQFNTSKAMKKKGKAALLISIASFFIYVTDVPDMFKNTLKLLILGGLGVWIYYAIRRIVMYFQDRRHLKKRLNGHPEYQRLLKKLNE